jgi:hypothetical protein
LEREGGEGEYLETIYPVSEVNGEFDPMTEAEVKMDSSVGLVT